MEGVEPLKPTLPRALPVKCVSTKVEKIVQLTGVYRVQ
jgi:hypothetical protein